MIEVRLRGVSKALVALREDLEDVPVGLDHETVALYRYKRNALYAFDPVAALKALAAADAH